MNTVKKRAKNEAILDGKTSLPREAEAYAKKLREGYAHADYLKAVRLKLIPDWKSRLNILKKAESIVRRCYGRSTKEIKECITTCEDFIFAKVGRHDVNNAYLGYVADCLAEFFKTKTGRPKWDWVGDLVVKNFPEAYTPLRCEDYGDWAETKARQWRKVRDRPEWCYAKALIASTSPVTHPLGVNPDKMLPIPRHPRPQ